MNKTVIIGVEQKLREDDVVGPEIVRTWQNKHPESADAYTRRN